MLGAYVATEGMLKATWDVVSNVCETHLKLSTAINKNDGQILLSDDGSYFSGGRTNADYAGTNTCGGSSAPATVNDDVEWWPTSQVRVVVHPDERLEET